jgi:hypothetical protein
MKKSVWLAALTGLAMVGWAALGTGETSVEASSPYSSEDSVARGGSSHGSSGSAGRSRKSKDSHGSSGSSGKSKKSRRSKGSHGSSHGHA